MNDALQLAPVMIARLTAADLRPPREAYVPPAIVAFKHVDQSGETVD